MGQHSECLIFRVVFQHVHCDVPSWENSHKGRRNRDIQGNRLPPQCKNCQPGVHRVHRVRETS